MTGITRQMERAAGLRHPKLRDQEKKRYNRTHDNLDDSQVAEIQNDLGDASATADSVRKRRRRGQAVDSIFGAYGLGG